MIADPLDFGEHFRDMTDDELLYRYSSGSLTEAAQSIATAELTSRGPEMPDPIIMATLRFRITAIFEAVFDIGGGFVMDDWVMEKVLCY